MKNVFFSAVAALLFSASVEAQSTVDSIAAKYKLVPMPEALTIEKTFPILGSYQLTTPTATAGTTMGTTNTTSTSNTSSTTTGSTTTTNDASVGSTTSSATSNGSVTTDASGMSSMSNVTITLDSFNKGMVWVEGLPQGKFAAYLKKSPATYRVTAQKTEAGTEIPEGTMYLDSTTKTLNIALGRAYDDVDPMAVFALNTGAAVSTDATTTAADAAEGTKVKVKTKTASSKKKEKLTFYSASKIETVAAPASTTTDSTQQQQTTTSDSTQQNQNQQQNQ